MGVRILAPQEDAARYQAFLTAVITGYTNLAARFGERMVMEMELEMLGLLNQAMVIDRKGAVLQAEYDRIKAEEGMDG